MYLTPKLSWGSNEKVNNPWTMSKEIMNVAESIISPQQCQSWMNEWLFTFVTFTKNYHGRQNAKRNIDWYANAIQLPNK